MEANTGDAKQAMQDAAGQAQEKAQQAAGQAKGKAREQIDQRSTEAGQRVSATAGDVRSVGDELRKQGKDGPARMADQVADRAERLGGYLQESDSDRMLSDIEDFGRRQPWAVVAGGLVLGFAASRFLKASSRSRYESSSSSSQFTNSGGSYGMQRPELNGPASDPRLDPSVTR
jgi:hypothetical protein